MQLLASGWRLEGRILGLKVLYPYPHFLLVVKGQQELAADIQEEVTKCFILDDLTLYRTVTVLE